jgi:processive 1,2-diacylglycerol beta-glucosyltransferase
MSKVLILSVAAGAGHIRAALALKKAINDNYPSATVEHVEVLEIVNAAFRRIYGKGYLDLVNHAPSFMGMIYDFLDKPARFSDKFLKMVNKFNLGPCIDLVSQDWDLIISTHFLPAEIIGALKAKGKIKTPQVLVTTDFDTHRFWMQEQVNLFTTATEEGKVYLQHFGADPAKIVVTGIPIDLNFALSDRYASQRKHGIDPNLPTILQLSGGAGVGPMEELYSALLKVSVPSNIISVCGKNTKAVEKLKAIIPPERHKVTVLGYTNEINELMVASDVVVSKPGGLTTSEVLATGGAMVIINPIPGQESRNNDYLLEEGAAVKVGNVATLSYKVETILSNPQKLQAIKANAGRIARPLAAQKIAQLSMQLIAC